MQDSVDLLIIGLGWQGEYIKNYFENNLRKIVAATTTTGRNNTISFKFDPQNAENFKLLPLAKCVLVTFPLPTEESGYLLPQLYQKATGGNGPFILLVGALFALICIDIITLMMII